MRKEQMFDWNRRYHKEKGEQIKKMQKFIRLHPGIKDYSLGENSGLLNICGTSLQDLHEIRTFLKDNIKWEDAIYSKSALDCFLEVIYKGKAPFDFIGIKINFPYDDLPDGILGTCYIKEEKTKVESYVSVSREIVCPLRGE